MCTRLLILNTLPFTPHNFSGTLESRGRSRVQKAIVGNFADCEFNELPDNHRSEEASM
jgi:hypothetical protein